MHTLSIQAKKRRREDMEQVASSVDSADFLRIIVIGGLLIIKNMAQKLTPEQRGLLAFLALVAGGSFIVFCVMNGLVWLALVVMFALGVVVAEISRL